MGVMMDIYNVTSKDEYLDFDGDIEKGELYVKQLEGGVVYGNNSMMKELECEGAKDGSIERGNESIIHEEMEISSFDSSSDDQLESVRLVVVDKNNRGVGRKVVKEKGKPTSAKKHPKPPRPPRGLSLDSADQKLIKELHELARVKRARVEPGGVVVPSNLVRHQPSTKPSSPHPPTPSPSFHCVFFIPPR